MSAVQVVELISPPADVKSTRDSWNIYGMQYQHEIFPALVTGYCLSTALAEVSIATIRLDLMARQCIQLPSSRLAQVVNVQVIHFSMSSNSEPVRTFYSLLEFLAVNILQPDSFDMLSWLPSEMAVEVL
ncbi:hypothetical protein J6590_102432, partial [Homalodisca vitripennis]